MGKIEEKALESDSLGSKALERIEEAVEKGDYKVAFRLFRNNIVKILCGEGILDVCSPYYYINGKIKEDKVAGEIIGAYEYYCASNRGFRSFLPHGDSFRCGRATAAFLQAVKKFLQLLTDNLEQDTWEILNDYMGTCYYDLENYLDQAGVYAFPHNRHSREITKIVLGSYMKKYYGYMDAGEFVEWYQNLDRVYTTYGFPFACTYKGWFFEGYDSLYRRIMDEGAWTLRNYWEHGASDWLKKTDGAVS